MVDEVDKGGEDDEDDGEEIFEAEDEEDAGDAEDTTENAQQSDGFNLMPTPNNFQRRPASSRTNYIEIEQSHDFGIGKSGFRLNSCFSWLKHYRIEPNDNNPEFNTRKFANT